jgi:hypothetical protein
MADDLQAIINVAFAIFRVNSSSLTLGFAVQYCKDAILRKLKGLASFDFSAQILQLFVRFIVGSDKDYSNIMNFINMSMSLYDIGYIDVTLNIINTYALTDPESSLLAAICFFGLLNSISSIISAAIFLKGDCGNALGFGVCLQLVVCVVWIVGFGRVLFYKEHNRSCNYPSLSGDQICYYTTSTIFSYINTAYGTSFPNVQGTNLFDISIKSAHMTGGWVSEGSDAKFCLLSNVAPSETSQDYIFYIKDNNYTKMLTANFYIN